MQAKTLCVPDEWFERYYRDSLRISKQSLINMIRSNGKYSFEAVHCRHCREGPDSCGRKRSGGNEKISQPSAQHTERECFICCIWIEARRTEFGLSATVCWAAGRVICWQKLTRLIFGAGYALENTLLEGAVESWKCGGLVQSGDAPTIDFKERQRFRRALVFLHGPTADHRMFAKQTEAFSRNIRLLPGTRLPMENQDPTETFTYAHLAAELSQILTAETIRKVVLIGQSMGGFAAQSFMTAHPDMVEGFVSIDSCPYGTVYYSKADFSG